MMVMSEPEQFYSEDDAKAEESQDPKQALALASVEKLIKQNPEKVFFSRQIEVQNEREFFHWITNRAIRELEGSLIQSELRPLRTGGSIKLLWNKSHRYYKRDATDVVKLVEEYADPNMGAALGRYGELMVLEGFAKKKFLLTGQGTAEHAGKKWTRTGHNLDFIFERDGRAYGIEVKNILPYMRQDEFRIKIEICREIGVIPVFAVRMLPKTWINELVQKGGFALIMKWQLYPFTHKDLARRVAKEFGLPVDAPQALQEGTVARFLDWHKRKLVN